MDLQQDAWRLAHAAGSSAGVSLVPLPELADVAHISSVIGSVWGPEADFPPGLVRAFQHSGAVLYGARAADVFVGFVFAFPGIEGGLHLHSHMLAVVPVSQNRGVGYALKLTQRAAGLERGIDDIRWTFDPLVAKNARFNLAKLGAVAPRYLPDFYGEMTDRLNRGDRSDRFEVRWMVASDRVGRALRGEAREPASDGPVILALEGDPDAPRPVLSAESPAPGARVQIPRDHHSIKSSDPPLAREWRDVAGRAFRECFAAGLVATWLTRDGEYVFEAEDEVGG